MKSFTLLVGATCITLSTLVAQETPLPALPKGAQLTLEEDWSSGKIDPDRWYPLRKKWGQGNHGVVPENVSLVRDLLKGGEDQRWVLQCEAHGDRYDGPVTGLWNKKTRVGGVLVSTAKLASGRFEVVMKVGSAAQPKPGGMVPAIWTYGYRIDQVEAADSDEFVASKPLYHPYLQQWSKGLSFRWSEIDFPEYGKAGEYEKPMYNTFLHKQHKSRTFDVKGAADGHYHTYVTDWRTTLEPWDDIKADQLIEAHGYWWVKDKKVPYNRYWGSPFKKLDDGRFALCKGVSAKHWIDGKFIGENTELVPVMEAQLNLGVWLPEWAGAADWEKATVRFASIRVWQFGDPGDVTGIADDRIGDSFGKDGRPK